MTPDVDLGRFLAAQDDMYDGVKAELGAGRKTGHWMWFVFPQVAGLGRSKTAQQFALESLEEAIAYAAHPVLGARLRECCRILLGTSGHSAQQIFGDPDVHKLRSSMTLFQAAAPDEPIFDEVLQRFYGGSPDPASADILGRWRSQA